MKRFKSFVLLGILAVAFISLVSLVVRVLTRGYTPYDERISETLRNLRSDALDIPFLTASLLGDWVVVTLTVTAMCFALIVRRQWKLLMGILFCMALAGIFVVGIKSFVQAPRPTDIYHGISSFSFPSGHATFSSLLAGLLSWFAWRNFKLPIAGVAMVLALLILILVPVSRIYLGAHWPSDVLAGILFSVCVVSLFAYVFEYLEVPPLLSKQVLTAALVTYGVAGMIYAVTHWQKADNFYIAPQ